MTDGMIKYRIRFKIEGRKITWERSCSEGMEACLQVVKNAIRLEYGSKWHGGLAICGPQGETDIYNF